MKRGKDQLASKTSGIVRASINSASLNNPPEHHLFAMVTDAVLVKPSDALASKFMWKYEIKPASFTWAGSGNIPTFAIRTGAVAYDAFSISELGNTASVFAYGVPLADIPAGLVPVRIPNNTPVFCWGHKREDGNFHWLIINTQAITGNCA